MLGAPKWYGRGFKIATVLLGGACYARAVRDRHAQARRPPAVRRSLLFVAAISTGLLLAVWWLTQGGAPPLRPPQAAQVTALPVPSVPSSAAPQATPAASPSSAAAAVRAALTRRLHDLPVPHAVLEALAEGRVAAALELLAAAPVAPAAAIAWEVVELCREGEPLAGPEREAAPAALALLRGRPSAEQQLGALISAQRELAARLKAGCAQAPLDAAAARRRLEAQAAAGDAQSLERLARSDAAGASRLQSAALLGSPGAAFRLGLELLQSGRNAAGAGERRQAGLSWLKAAAQGSADAEAWYASCLLEGCGGAADPAAARAALESAARRGSIYALGLLSAPPTDSPAPWSTPEDVVAPLPSADAAAFGLDGASHYAWSVLAARLATAGCFGFAWRSTAEALTAPERIAPSLSPAGLAAAAAAAELLVNEAAGPARAALGCEGG